MNWKQAIIATLWTVIKVTVIIVFVVYVYRFAVKSYDTGYRIFADTAIEEAPGRDVTVAVVEGKSGKEIGSMLVEKGLIENALLFSIQLKCSSYAESIKPGIYTLNTSMTPYEMMAVMAGGE